MKIKLLLVFLAAFLFRVILIPVAHHGDLNNNISWGEELLDRGVSGFYGSDKAEEWPYSAPNQPPLYLYLFGGVVQTYRSVDELSRFLNESVGVFPSSFVWYWEEQGMDLVAKLPSILADLGIGYLIYRYVSYRYRPARKSQRMNDDESRDSRFAFAPQNDMVGILIASIWLFNPLTWYNSSIWGQTDPIVNFLGLVAILGLVGQFKIVDRVGKLPWFTFWFTVAFLFKPSLSIFIPILVLFILQSKFPITEYLKAGLLSILTIFFVSVWFYPHLNFVSWIIDLYSHRILPGEIGYLTANAFNLWWLVDSGKVLDSTVYFGLSARMWSLIITLCIFALLSSWFYRKKQSAETLFTALTVSAAIAFLFLTRIHERYLYPFFPYATLLIGLAPKYWIYYLVFSITYLLNMYHLFWVPTIPWLEIHLTSWGSIITLLNLLSFIGILRQVYRSKI